MFSKKQAKTESDLSDRAFSYVHHHGHVGRAYDTHSFLCSMRVDASSLSYYLIIYFLNHRFLSILFYGTINTCEMF